MIIMRWLVIVAAVIVGLVSVIASMAMVGTPLAGSGQEQTVSIATSEAGPRAPDVARVLGAHPTRANSTAIFLTPPPSALFVQHQPAPRLAAVATDDEGITAVRLPLPSGGTALVQMSVTAGEIIISGLLVVMVVLLLFFVGYQAVRA